MKGYVFLLDGKVRVVEMEKIKNGFLDVEGRVAFKEEVLGIRWDRASGADGGREDFLSEEEGRGGYCAV